LGVMTAVAARPAAAYNGVLEAGLTEIERLMTGDYVLSRRAVALLLLQEDEDITAEVRARERERFAEIERVAERVRGDFAQPLSQVITVERQQWARRLLAGIVTEGERPRAAFAERLSRLMMHPVAGPIILAAVLYLGLYQLVGVLGAGVVAGFLENRVFGDWVNPWCKDAVSAVIPWNTLQDLFVGQYGVITLGLTYAFAIILPIVTTFFIAFSVIEDSGYLPRLALLVDRLFKRIGLSGRAVIPMVLGFGCVTMATLVTRTQETRRERLIVTLLLALGIPCAAQLGVVFAILSGNGLALAIWALVVAGVLISVGFLASLVLPGERAAFYIEVPPLRWPRPSNLMGKTVTRIQWYLGEVMPVFIFASVLLWLGDITGVYDVILRGLEPVVRAIGLPAEVAPAFLYGFFRRDFGAAGLYHLHASGALVGVPLLVSAVTLTLFLPCIAQFLVMTRERGVKTALAIALFIFPFSFLVGFVLDRVLRALGVTL